MQPELVEQLSNEHLEETYLGVQIWKYYDQYTCDVWSEENQENIEYLDSSIENIKEQLNAILAYNYFHSLKVIQYHFRHKMDFNNPIENLENLRVAINVKISEQLQDL